jgi:pimeloyl-ACP methyl ester carboxylesterase
MSKKSVLITNGFKISCQQWGSPHAARKVLCLHGWLDNSNSFKYLGPYLADRGFYVVAYDNIGKPYASC